MRARPQMTPLIATTAAALVGAVAGIVLLRATPLDSWFTPQPGLKGSIVSMADRPSDRLPSEPHLAQRPRPATRLPGEPQLVAGPQLEPSWRMSVLPRSSESATEAWSTEIQPIAPKPQPVRQARLSRPDASTAKKPVTQSKKRRRRKQSVTLKSRLAEISPGATRRLIAKFAKARVAWPPADIAFVAIKDERVLQLYARAKGKPWQFIHRYPVLAASGGLGPKLRQGDRQVPEGVYRIVYLNPRSAYHVSLRVNYPNAFDRKMARREKRKRLGGDIMIHGRRSSAGCLAMGDPAVEELFVLAAKTGYRKVRLVIAPTDFRTKERPLFKPGQPKWLPQLYKKIASALTEFKPPPEPPGLLSFFFPQE